MFNGELPQRLSADDLLRLSRDGVCEDRFLEYKAAPYAKDTAGTYELLKDVCALANGDGGFLIIGVRDDGHGRATGIVNIPNAESVRQSIFERCLQRIEPRLRTLTITVVQVKADVIIVCRVPSSDDKPVCARPDREHHFFWRRYDDGNRLMSVDEIRQCFEGDRIAKSMNDIRKALDGLEKRSLHVVDAWKGVNDRNVLQVQDVNAFLAFVNKRFRDTVRDVPYYRLTATPNPINQIDLRAASARLRPLLEDPPKVRLHGFDLSVFGGFRLRESALGIERTNNDYNYLCVYWNGHVEFWSKLSSLFLDRGTPSEDKNAPVFLDPVALSEPAANFVRFVQAVCTIAGHTGGVQFSLALSNVRGVHLAPGHPDSIGYMKSKSDIGRPAWGALPFPDESAVATHSIVNAVSLPADVQWHLVSQVYRSFGYLEDRQVPFFDETRRFTLAQA